MFNCYLCQEQVVYTKYFCCNCENIKRILNVYGKEKVLEILEKVCLRKSEKLQTYKINDIKKELEKDVEDESNLQKPNLNLPQGFAGHQSIKKKVNK